MNDINSATVDASGDPTLESSVGSSLNVKASVDLVIHDIEIDRFSIISIINNRPVRIGQRILVKDQNNKSNNGIYCVNNNGSLEEAEDWAREDGSFAFCERYNIGYIYIEEYNIWEVFSGSNKY